MMVETMLESSQDFGCGAGMSNGALPQWKRELLQRRAARSRPAAPPAQPPPPPPPPPADDDEELRYGPGIVKRLKSRYLSLALRDAPRRRPSVLRRAASLEHLLDERPPPVPCARPTTHPRPPRPQSMAAPPVLLGPAQRRESVKRARSVDALSRIDVREDPRATSTSPPPALAARPPQSQTRPARTPRRPTPLLRETERPPPDVVRSTLRKFESAPTRRAAPAARVSAVLRGLEGPRTSTPEPRDPADGPPLSPRTPSPLPPPDPAPATSPTTPDESTPEGAVAGARPVSRAALDGIARAGSTVRYAFEAPRAGSHLPPLSATNTVLVGRARRIGVIRPMPARSSEAAEETPAEEIDEKTPERSARLASPPPSPSSPPPVPVENETPPPNRVERRDPPPAALVEPIPRTPPDVPRPATPPTSPPPPVIMERSPSPEPKMKTKPDTITAPLMNGHVCPERTLETKGAISRIGAAGIERAWSGSGEKKATDAKEKSAPAVPWARPAGGSPGAARRPRAPQPASTSVVFNFSNRKEVPDYIENDGIILRGSRRNRIKAGEPGVVVLRPEALARSDSDSETETDGGPPSPCAVRFINDNVLINGRSSMPGKPNKDRIAKLKLQFDDSLTRTFEYPSEMSLCEESPPAPSPGAAAVAAVAAGAAGPAGVAGAAGAPAPAAAAPTPQLAESPLHVPLAANTHIAVRPRRRMRMRGRRVAPTPPLMLVLDETFVVGGAVALHAEQDCGGLLPAGRHAPRQRRRRQHHHADRGDAAVMLGGQRRRELGRGRRAALWRRRGALVERGAHARYRPALLVTCTRCRNIELNRRQHIESQMKSCRYTSMGPS